MSADTLREAAALMRSDAEKATPGRWKAWGMQALADQDGTSNVDTAMLIASTYCHDEDGRPRTFDLDHIIGMQPAVALAVADWLDSEADLDDVLKAAGARGKTAESDCVKVAAAYLGNTT